MSVTETTTITTTNMQGSEAGIPVDGFIRIKTEFTPNEWNEENMADGSSGSEANSKKRKAEDALTDEETKLLEENMMKKMDAILQGRIHGIKQELNVYKAKFLREIKNKRAQDHRKKPRLNEDEEIEIDIKEELIEQVNLDSEPAEPAQNPPEMAPVEELTWEDLQACESKKELILVSGKIDEILDAREKIFEEKWKKFEELKKELEKEAKEIKINRQQKADMLVAKMKEFEDKERENEPRKNSSSTSARKINDKKKIVEAKKSDSAAKEKQDGTEQRNQKIRDDKGKKEPSVAKSSKAEDQAKAQPNGATVPKSPKPLKLVRKKISGPEPSTEPDQQKTMKKDAAHSPGEKSSVENRERKDLPRSPSPGRYDDDDDVDNLSLRTVESVHSDDEWGYNGPIDGEIERIRDKLAELEGENAQLEGRIDEYDPLNPTSDGGESFDVGCLENMSLPRSRSNESGEIWSSSDNERLSRSRSKDRNRGRNRRIKALSRSLSKESDKREWRKTTRSSKSPVRKKGSPERARAPYLSRNKARRSSKSPNDGYRHQSNDNSSRDSPRTSRGEARWSRKDDFPARGSPNQRRYSRERRDNDWTPKSSQERFEKDRRDSEPLWKSSEEQYYEEENRRKNPSSFRNDDNTPPWKRNKPKKSLAPNLRPPPMTIDQWQEEKICRNTRKRNILIKGLDPRSQTREYIAEFISTHLQVQVTIENLIKDPQGVVITCSTASEKFLIMQRRYSVKGKVWIGEDYTKMQENLQEWLKKTADNLRRRGDKIKLGQQKIRINGQEFVWNALKGSLVPDKKL